MSNDGIKCEANKCTHNRDGECCWDWTDIVLDEKGKCTIYTTKQKI
jgi:hypothetical protein